MGVWAYGRIGVSACTPPLTAHHSNTPRPGLEDEDEKEGPAAGKPGLAIRKNVN
jgi:hypothetical protein